MNQTTISKPSILKQFYVLNNNKPLDRQIKPFNFMLIGTETNGVIPCLPYTKDISGIQYRPFTDYRTDQASNELPLPTTAYWKSLENILTQYVRHNDNKFDYINGIAQRKHIIVDRFRYIGKESNNLDETEVIGISDNNYVIYDNKTEQKIIDVIKKLTPKQVKHIGISKRNLRYLRKKVKTNKQIVLKKKTVKKLMSY